MRNFESGVYATDASRGLFAQQPFLLRVGCAVVLVSSDDPFQVDTAVAQILPVPEQSKINGELHVVLMLARFANPYSILHVLTDSEHVYKTYSKAEAYQLTLKHADFLSLFSQLVPYNGPCSG